MPFDFNWGTCTDYEEYNGLSPRLFLTLLCFPDDSDTRSVYNGRNCWSFDGNNFTTISDTNHTHDVGQLTTYKGHPLAIAGYKTLSTEQLDAYNGKWTDEANLPKVSVGLGLFYFSAVSLSDYSYVFGGQDGFAAQTASYRLGCI